MTVRLLAGMDDKPPVSAASAYIPLGALLFLFLLADIAIATVVNAEGREAGGGGARKDDSFVARGGALRGGITFSGR